MRDIVRGESRQRQSDGGGELMRGCSTGGRVFWWIGAVAASVRLRANVLMRPISGVMSVDDAISLFYMIIFCGSTRIICDE